MGGGGGGDGIFVFDLDFVCLLACFYFVFVIDRHLIIDLVIIDEKFPKYLCYCVCATNNNNNNNENKNGKITFIRLFFVCVYVVDHLIY